MVSMEYQDGEHGVPGGCERSISAMSTGNLVRMASKEYKEEVRVTKQGCVYDAGRVYLAGHSTGAPGQRATCAARGLE